MALIKCSECGKKYKNNKSSCPECGFPNKKEISVVGVLLKTIGIIFGIIFVISFLYAFFSFQKPKLDITGNTMEEYLDIIETYGQDIDLSAITPNASYDCSKDTQTEIITSKKYGVVIVEYAFCDSSNVAFIHIYN